MAVQVWLGSIWGLEFKSYGKAQERPRESISSKCRRGLSAGFETLVSSTLFSPATRNNIAGRDTKKHGDQIHERHFAQAL